MCRVKGSLREGAPDGVGWRSTRNPKRFMLLQYECKFLTYRNSFRQPHRSPLVRSGCHLPQEGGFRAHPLHSRLYD